MSKISPCLWFDGEAEEAAKFYVSLLPDSRIERIQKNLVDGPAGKAGTVLVVQFTLAGQQYMALNGGTRFEYTHAISFKSVVRRSGSVDLFWATIRSFLVPHPIYCPETASGSWCPTPSPGRRRE